MTQCEHENCGREYRLWLPDGPYVRTDIQLHPWCVHCGQIKNISDDQGKKVGYWNNVLSRLNSHLPMTQVQKRLVIQAIVGHNGFSDLYAVTETAQKDVFVSFVNTFTKYPKKTIYEWLK